MTTVVVWTIAFSLGFLVWRRKGWGQVLIDLRAAMRQGVVIIPRILMVIIVAGFMLRLMPEGFITQVIGPDSGFVGVLYAILVGAMIPGGASITFSIVILLAEAGAGQVQMVALLTSWSVFALHRVFIYEIPLMGLRFSLVRLIISLPMPLLAAGMAWCYFWLLRQLPF